MARTGRVRRGLALSSCGFSFVVFGVSPLCCRPLLLEEVKSRHPRVVRWVVLGLGVARGIGGNAYREACNARTQFEVERLKLMPSREGIATLALILSPNG